MRLQTAEWPWKAARPGFKIKENDFNLNIPRYVDTFEEEEPIILEDVISELRHINEEMKEVDAEIKKYCDELGIDAPVFDWVDFMSEEKIDAILIFDELNQRYLSDFAFSDGIPLNPGVLIT